MANDLISLKQAFLIVLDHLEKMDGVPDSEKLGDPKPFQGYPRRVTANIAPTGPEYIASYLPIKQPGPRIGENTRGPTVIIPLRVPSVPSHGELNIILNDYRKSRNEMTNAEIRICRVHEILSSNIYDKNISIFGAFRLQFEHTLGFSVEEIDSHEFEDIFLDVDHLTFNRINDRNAIFDYYNNRIIYPNLHDYKCKSLIYRGVMRSCVTELSFEAVKSCVARIKPIQKFDFGIEEDAIDGSWTIRWKGGTYKLPARTTIPETRGLRAISLMTKFRGCDIAVALLFVTAWLDKDTRPKQNNHKATKKKREMLKVILHQMMTYSVDDSDSYHFFVKHSNESVLTIATNSRVKLDDNSYITRKSATVGSDDLREVKNSINKVINLLNYGGGIFSEIARFVEDALTVERWYARMSFEV
jgi:hypothetical protein